MHNLRFTYYPEKTLRMKASPVDFDGEPPEDLLNLIEQMKDVCREKEGAGLSAQPVGLVLPVMVCGVPRGGGRYDLVGVINPKIIDKSDDTLIREEGCLSFPGLYFPVERPRKIVAEGWFDDVKRRDKRELVGMAARIFCHENDHINGILFIDRADKITRERIKPQLKKIAQETMNRK